MKQGAFSIEFNSQFIALGRVAGLIALCNLSIVELGTNFPGYNFNTVVSNGGCMNHLGVVMWSFYRKNVVL